MGAETASSSSWDKDFQVTHGYAKFSIIKIVIFASGLKVKKTR